MQFLWLNIYNGKYQDFLESIKNPKKKTLVFTPNPEILLRASRDKEFLDILKKADYLTPDANWLYTATLMQEGTGFIGALFRTLFSKKNLREQYGELIQWSNLTRDFVEYAVEQGKKILIIDNYRIIEPQNEFEIAKKKTQENIIPLFHEKLPWLDVEVVFDDEVSPEDIAKKIQEENISYVFSCIGMKTQEQRLLEIFWHLLEDTPVVWLGVGSSFDYLLGLQRRAPRIFQQLWIEWFYRLMMNPRARWWRIMDAFWRFPRIIKNHID